MKTKLAFLLPFHLALTLFPAGAAVRYVNLANANPAPPYTNWATAAENIQHAVDAASAGDEIVVTNGVYATGGRAVFGIMTNRVAVTKPVIVRSVNGPEVTVIRGYQVPSMTNGVGAVRCVYLASGATLVGFTLTNGATLASGDFFLDQAGGGAWCESTGAVVSNCVLSGNSAIFQGGGAYQGTLKNCTLNGNTAGPGSGDLGLGGGALGCILDNCVLTGNWASSRGGGAYYGTLNNCTLTRNSARSYGGGANESTLNNCTITSNSSGFAGGGAALSTLNNCKLTRNSASAGGGACCGTLNNCMITGNTAGQGGGGWGGTFNNCTISSNTASQAGGASGTLNNCIVYYNAGENYYDSTVNYSCTTPLPPNGVGNITDEPQLVDSSHLATSSPCRGRGFDTYATGVDIDGQPWAFPPSMGCDEYHPITEPLSVAIRASRIAVAVGTAIDFAPQIEGQATMLQWDFGDGTVVSNQSGFTHRWAASGDYSVVVTAYNDAHAEGVTNVLRVLVVADPVLYVSLDSAEPHPPFGSWRTAARTIQDAVDMFGGGTIIVSNGVYNTGGTLGLVGVSNRVSVVGPISLRSFNGPEVTTIDGGGAMRCIYLSDSGAALSGFTLTNGDAFRGGGVFCVDETVTISNCVITASHAMFGGGASGGTLYDCRLLNNIAYGTNCFWEGEGCWGGDGGGAANCTLIRCILSGNSAHRGGGASESTLTGCTLIGNSASNGGGVANSTLNNCTLSGNWARFGGGASGGLLRGCAMFRNSATSEGGGACGSTLNNCTLTGNSALQSGGGVCGGEANNCIIYHNTAPYNENWPYRVGTLRFCCTTPDPGDGYSITAEPELVSHYYLSIGSPCRGAGSAAHAIGVDIDGEPWSNPPSIGCDEYVAGPLTGPLSVAIQASDTNVVTGVGVNFIAQIDGRIGDSRWEFGDGTGVSGHLNATHAWAAAGDYPVVLRAYNFSHPDGVSATTIVHVIEQPVHYVSLHNPTPMAPYTSWATAANSIQEAIDAATLQGSLILVSNGVYQTGVAPSSERGAARVAVTKKITVRSANGPEVTVIQGQAADPAQGSDAIRCVYLSDGGKLEGFSLIHGVALSGTYLGGGVLCESQKATLSNCMIVSNSAGLGGGAYSGTLDNCTLENNSADAGGGALGCVMKKCTLSRNSTGGAGGGAVVSMLSDCVLTGNSSRTSGGGASQSTLLNCVLSSNSAPNGGGADSSMLRNCTVVRNLAHIGGGVSVCNVGNSIIYGNTATNAGGAFVSTLNNCTVTGNSALRTGGGVLSGAIINSIVSSNTAPEEANFTEVVNVPFNGVSASSLNFCCTAPLPISGMGNITNAPLFVNFAGDNLSLQSNSPCINAGRSLDAPGRLDLGGNPRIVAGTVDIGAYEFQNPASTLSYFWLQRFGLPIDGSADFADPDADNFNNFQEWRAGTDPMSPLSALRLLTPSFDGIRWLVSWQSVPERTYTVERSANLSVTNGFLPVVTPVPGQLGTTSVIDTNSTAPGPAIYRVRVEE